MSREILLLECVNQERMPSLPMALLAGSIAEAAEHRRVQVQEHSLRAFGDELFERGTGAADLALVFLDTRFPVIDAAAFVAAVAPAPVFLVGPYALDRFEQIPVRGAILGPPAGVGRSLAVAALRGPGHPTSREIRACPRALLREHEGGTEVLALTTLDPWPSAAECLLPFLPRLDWEYHGPRRRGDPAASRGAPVWWPIPPAATRPAADVPPPALDRRWSARSRSTLEALLERDPEASCFEVGPGSEKDALRVLDEQVHVYEREGHRAWSIEAPDPFPLLLPWLQTLDREGRRAEEIVLSPSVRALRLTEGVRRDLLTVSELSRRLILTCIDFGNFDDRSLVLRGRRETQWDNRWAARLLIELEGSSQGRVSATQGHRIALLDPWSRPRDLLDSLVAIDEEAPFLKPEVHPGSVLPVPSRHGVLGRRLADAGLLQAGNTPSGWSYVFAAPEMGVYLDLAHQGLGPLLESIGRLRLPAQQRQRAIEEARFRWMRQLAERFTSEPEGAPSDSWGKTLASVTRDVAASVRRSEGPA